MNPQASIAHYRITSKLGEGGMGAVYRATDTKLGREVAIKVLPEAFARDVDRMARFEREAQMLAALNHPNIASIYGIEQNALVMELVEGEVLQGPLCFETAILYARQIALALETAHDKGIIHRDLKPANIKVTPEGVVKVLDFGLAKASEGGVTSNPGNPTISPTLALGMTQAGVILGTAAYMSPEQARGKPVDKRADVWAFGAVLYEMLTGSVLFAGAETLSDSLAAVITKEPDWNKLPCETPPHIRRLLEQCLRKDPRTRLRDIGDARIALEQPDAAGPATTAASDRRRSRLPWAVAALLAIVAGVASWFAWRVDSPGPRPLTRLNVDLGPTAMTGVNLTAAISPDGRRLVFPSRGPDGKQQLAMRILDQAQPTLLPGTENGSDPFFSPGGDWVGFVSDNKLKKVSVLGGATVTLCDATYHYGASWGEDGNIVGALNLLSGLFRVPANGGKAQPFTKLEKGEVTHRWPQVLPGGQAVLFTASPSAAGMENASIRAIWLKTGVTKTLVTGAHFARYLPTNGSRGHLVYMHLGVLYSAPFDLARLELQGAPAPVLEDVAANPTFGGGQLDFSQAGTLVYLAGKGAGQTWPVMWLDGAGKMLPLLSTPGAYVLPRFSPDGRRLALTITGGTGTDIYLYDWQRETMTRLTFTGHAHVPVWTPDGMRLAFQSSADGFGIWWIRTDGSGDPERLLDTGTNSVPWSFTPDGRRLAYFEGTGATAYDIWTLPLDPADPQHVKAGSPELFLRTLSDELAPVFSPDGRWIAYRSNESGVFEIYVRPFPPGRGGKWQISSEGGMYGLWSNNGRELFYETLDNRIMVVDYVVDHDSFVPGKARVWSDRQTFFTGSSNLALHPDGKRFAVFPMPDTSVEQKGSVHVTFLLNFFDELRRATAPK